MEWWQGFWAGTMVTIALYFLLRLWDFYDARRLRRRVGKVVAVRNGTTLTFDRLSTGDILVFHDPNGDVKK